MKNKTYIGHAWVGNRQKIIYACQEIHRGKNKGKFTVEYLVGTHTEGKNKGKFRYKKCIVFADKIRLLDILDS